MQANSVAFNCFNFSGMTLLFIISYLYFPYEELYISLVGEVLLVYGMCRHSYLQLSMRQLGVQGYKEIFLKMKGTSLNLGHWPKGCKSRKGTLTVAYSWEWEDLRLCSGE